METKFWFACAKALYFGEDFDCQARMYTCMHGLVCYGYPKCCISIQEKPSSGDDLVKTVVENLRAGGVCLHFRSLFQNL